MDYINSQDSEKARNRAKATLFNDLILLLESTMHDDRYAIPAVDMLSFLLDTLVTGQATELDVE